ncbi:MAG TPA: transcription antiterminator BglG [Firmicutes bacterium]|nr:transcription antiterminator BglG [Bacillota bacterium]
MRIKKVFNNNVLLAEDDQQLEMILLGVGIAFQKKPGEEVDLSKIDKKFIIESDDTKQKFVELLRDVPINHLELTSKIIKQAESELNTTFNDSIYIGLTDHINYSLFRAKQGIALKNALMWEVKKFYPREFIAAMNCLKTIKLYENVSLPEDEASFIALHFVNAQQYGEAMKSTVEATEVIQSILNILKFHYRIEIDETSLNYSRFVTHIRYFIRRFMNDEIIGTDEDEFLFLQVKGKYPKAYECSLKVQKYLESKFSMPITNNEMLYFMLHINRVAERELKK